MAEHTERELEALESYRGYVAQRELCVRGDAPWSAIGAWFTEDAVFIDPAWGRVEGRDAIAEFFDHSMAGFEGWSFPEEWTIASGDRLVTFWWNRLPGVRADGTTYQAPAFSVLHYAGDGVFDYELDLMNIAEVMDLLVESSWVPGAGMSEPGPSDYDLSGLAAINNGSAPLTPGLRAQLLEALPHIVVTDVAGASETGLQMSTMSMKGMESEAATFTPVPTTTVVDEQFTRSLEPGEGSGWLAQRGRVPIGYLGDQEKTARTFPVIDGVRYSIPGDRAEILADGRILLLGRDSVTINSGGEKIFVEEVERAIAAHPDVRDVVVVGRPSERWGSEAVAVVQVVDASDVTDEELLVECSRHVARYKVPKAIVRCVRVERSPSGKADYRWAKAQAVDAN